MPRRTRKHVAEFKLRLLRTLAEREAHGVPPPGRDWFTNRGWDMACELADERMLTSNPLVRLTALGRRFLDANPVRVTAAAENSEQQKPSVPADNKPKQKPGKK